MKDIVEAEIDQKDLDTRIMQKNNSSCILFISYMLLLLTWYTSQYSHTHKKNKLQCIFQWLKDAERKLMKKLLFN